MSFKLIPERTRLTHLDISIRQQAHDLSIWLRFDKHLQLSAQALEASVIKTMWTENAAFHGKLALLQELFQENLGRKKPKEAAVNSLRLLCGFLPIPLPLVVANIFATTAIDSSYPRQIVSTCPWSWS